MTRRSDVLGTGEIETAVAWFEDNRATVLAMLAYPIKGEHGPMCPPAANDCAHPERWTRSHWRWFLKDCATHPDAYEG